MEFGQLPLDTDTMERFSRQIDAPPRPAQRPAPRRVIENGATLSDLNLEKELVEQYLKVKNLMDEVAGDDGVPANQRAQVANSVVSALGQLYKLQEDLQRDERLKLMESCLIDALKVLPEETKAEFFEHYEALARKAGLAE